MPILEIKINDKTFCLAGGENAPQVGVYVGNSPESEKVKISINGYREVGAHKSEHREWPGCTIEDGDEVKIILKSSGEVSDVLKCSTFDSQPQHDKLQDMIAEMVAKQRLSGEGPGPVLSEDSAKKARYFCSFCSKHSSEVDKLIAGPHVNICSECLETCNSLIEEGGDGK